MSNNRFFTYWNVILSKLEDISAPSRPSWSSLAMADTYLWTYWIFFCSWYVLNLTLQLRIFPLVGESGTYPGITRTWVAVVCDSPVRQLVFGLYTICIGSYESMWYVSSSDIDWCPLLLYDIGVASASKYVPKHCLTRSTKIGSAQLLLYWPVLCPCWNLTETMHPAYDIIQYYYCLNSWCWASYALRQ